jgi:hypothetical protein
LVFFIKLFPSMKFGQKRSKSQWIARARIGFLAEQRPESRQECGEAITMESIGECPCGFFRRIAANFASFASNGDAILGAVATA